MTPTTPQALSDERAVSRCAHCGSGDIYVGWYSGNPYIACRSCGISIGGEEPTLSAGECIERWNRRAAHEEAAAAREPEQVTRYRAVDEAAARLRKNLMLTYEEETALRTLVDYARHCPPTALAATPLRMEVQPVAVRWEALVKDQWLPCLYPEGVDRMREKGYPVRALGVIETAKEGKRCKECTTPNGCKLDGCMRDLYGYRSTPPAASQPEKRNTCREPDGRCGVCGGDWSVCGCQGMLNRMGVGSQPEEGKS